MRAGGPVVGRRPAALALAVALGLVLEASAPAPVAAAAAPAGLNGHVRPLPVSAEAVVLIDLETGKVLFEKNAEEDRAPPAWSS